MSASSRKIDRLQATFDHEGIVANAGLIVAATLMARLGLEASNSQDLWMRFLGFVTRRPVPRGLW